VVAKFRVVLDPSFRGTQVEDDIQALTAEFNITMQWHEGSQVRPDSIPKAFRGADIVELAHATVAETGVIDAATIGRALRNFPYSPPSPSGDPESSPLQRYKNFGTAASPWASPPRARHDAFVALTQVWLEGRQSSVGA